MSMFSMTSSAVTPSREETVWNGYRFTTRSEMGSIPFSVSALMCSARSRRARSPPCTAGCSVLTRPSSISGKPVSSLTSRTVRPALRSAFAVPPVDASDQPRRARPCANSTTPVLSDTEKSARGISEVRIESGVVHGGDDVDDARIHDVLRRKNALGERFSRVVDPHPHPPLGDDRAVIVFVVDEMDCESRARRARRQDRRMYARSVHAWTAEIRKQSRMDVDDPAVVAPDHIFR